MPSIAIIHPDLGIGGAERLILDVANAVRTATGPVIWTSRYEPNRAFSDASSFVVNVRGNFIPRHIFGCFHIFFALLRNLWVTICCARSSPATVFIVDQISAWIPVLRWLRPDARIIFYCHYPDLLLAPRASTLRKLYRLPFDWIEKFGIAKAHTILVNSEFTASKVKGALNITNVKVLYPCFAPPEAVALTKPDEPTFLSLNRYERKKDHALAIRALAVFREADGRGKLVIAGGFDSHVAENVAVHGELKALANELGLADCVAFRQNIQNEEKWSQIGRASAVLYTPQNEHFGIVPIEAISLGVPVIACDSGGPLESVACEGCKLCRPTPEAFARAMRDVVNDANPQRTEQLKTHAAQFGFERFREKWAEIIGD
jgi:alpha-1,3/alpha-1,6-mannosyltransferase